MLAAEATPRRLLSPPDRGLLAAAAAAACAALLYLPSVHYGFVFDDLSLLTAAGEPVALGGALPYRPLRYASYLVDWRLGGSATVFHAHNVLLHALATALTVLVARRLGATALAAFAGALVVALHPMAVESAAYVAGRRDLLCVALGLASLVAQLGGRTRVALALLFGSVAAKESGLVFAAPLAVAAVLHVPAPARLLRALAATGAVAAAAAAMSIASGAVGPWLPGSGAFAGGGRVLLHYATGLAGARALAPEYPALYAPAAAGDVVFQAAALFALAAFAAAALLCVRARRGAASNGDASYGAASNGDASYGDASPARAARHHAFVFAWTAVTALSLALWAGVHEPGADRHAYLVLPPLAVGLSLLVTRVLHAVSTASGESSDRGRSERGRLLVPDTSKRPRSFPGQRFRSYSRGAAAFAARSALAACGLVLAAAAALSTREQMQVWSSERALWSHAVAQGGASARAHANLARVTAAGGEYATARRHLASALEAGGDDGLVYTSRAALRCAEGRRSLAQRDVRRAHRAGAAALVEEIARDCGLSLHARMHRKRGSGRPVEALGK